MMTLTPAWLWTLRSRPMAAGGRRCASSSRSGRLDHAQIAARLRITVQRARELDEALTARALSQANGRAVRRDDVTTRREKSRT